MNNVQITNVRPKRNNDGAYIIYSAALKPSDHTINGSFTATNDETKDALNNNENWDGFKKLAIKRLENDVKNIKN